MLTIVARTATYSTAALAHDVRLAVMRLSRRLRALRVEDTTLTHLAAMSTLARNGPMTPGELAAHEKVRPPSMTRVVAAMEEAGYVTRTPHPTDGRQIIISLSPAGKALLEEEVRMREAWLCKKLSELSKEERETLRAASEIITRLVGS